MSTDYFIGVNDAEVDRLCTQHEAWRPETDLLWHQAGFASCRSILDLGCGPGFTSMDLARVVGPSGEICAVDKAERFLRSLAERARALGVTNIRTLNADLARRQSISGPFDGVFGRWFLAFLRDDLDVALENIRQSLRPGGVFAAMEYPDAASLRARRRARPSMRTRVRGSSSTRGMAATRPLGKRCLAGWRRPASGFDWCDAWEAWPTRSIGGGRGGGC